ncbi:type 1 fimbrial protein [Pantoea dispersa]|uniref:fimbrial protein n=1 Tax=Pantoea dispersa TaxID=59814 RepID=UPI0021AF878F|nr:fimbrial protein [Pantoea dispersa]MCT6592550.1 type 1 fimbrial protein [Pantoea dispersa]MCW0323427.1 Protein FimF [Pantoea dispersa]MCW0328163.1 Protein FimF [Pantoea dispersa]MCW0434638.1 Protein FimF [Pantoea dispersa]
MSEKKPLLAALLLFTVTAAGAADTTVTVTGVVHDNTCTVQAGSADFSVNLLQTASKQLATPGAASPPVPFSISFSRCGSSATAVRIGFTGSADPDNNRLLKADAGTGAAQGVAIQLLTGSQVPVAINAAQSDLSWLTLTAGQPAVLQFWARMMAVRTPVVAGTVSATAGVTLEFQ